MAFSIPSIFAAMKTHACSVLALIVAGLCLTAPQCLRAEIKPVQKDLSVAFMASQKEDSITVKPDARLTRDYDEAWERWLERVLMEPFVKRMDEHPGSKEPVLRFARSALRIRMGTLHQEHGISSDQLANEADAVLKLKVDDPMIYWLAGWARYEARHRIQLALNVVKKSLDHPKLAECSPYLRYLVLRTMEKMRDAAHATLTDEERAAFYKDLVESAKRATVDPATYGPTDDEIQMENLTYLINPNIIDQTSGSVGALFSLTSLSGWGRLMLAGDLEQSLAWVARGHDWASKVTPEGQKGMTEHLAKAEDCFLKAWKLHPDRPQAATAMIPIAGNTGNLENGEVRQWFDRAMAARFDYEPAYAQMLNYYRPRWGGSHAKMMAFGLACAMTQRYDTSVPGVFYRVLVSILQESDDDWRPLLRNAFVAPVIKDISEHKLSDPARIREESDLYGEYALLAWASGDFHQAALAFQKAGPSFSPQVSRLADWFRATERCVRGESAIYDAGAGESWEAGEEAYKKANFEEATQKYEKAAKELAPNASDLITARLGAVRFEKELAGGGWTPLKADPKLLDWDVPRGGHWEGTDDGQLIVRDTEGESLICFNGRVGNRFEIRGEYQVEGVNPAGGLGIVVGYGWRKREANWWLPWITALQYGSATESFATVMDRFSSSDVKQAPIPPSTGRYTFDVICMDNRITYSVNGQKVFDDQAVGEYGDHRPLQVLAGSRVGFGHFHFQKKNITRLIRAEVRLVK
jgi:hypothetical protein